MSVCWIDFETRSRCDLKKFGLYHYAQDPSTQIVIACYALDLGPVERWEWIKRDPISPRLTRLLRDPDVEIRSHNAGFERLLLKHCWKLDLPLARFHCTSFQARAAALPGSLGDLGRALSAKLQKDTRGYDLIRLLSVPRENGTFCEEPDLYREFADYCARDVEVMRQYSLALPALSQDARALYAASEAVNDAGLPIDTELCRLALGYADAERAQAVANVQRITSGLLQNARGKHLTRWIHDNLPEKAARLMEIVKRVSLREKGAPGTAAYLDRDSGRPALTDKTYDSLTLDATTRAAIFQMREENPEDFNDDVMAVLGANDAVQSASVHKFKSMLDRVSPDKRLRGAFIANGASGTGRFSSKGAQVHNFPRVTAKDPEAVKTLMVHAADLPGPVLEVLKSMLRPAIAPGRGRVIVRSDWNAVEARALPWLTGRASAVVYLDAFRDPKRDIYVEQARLCGLGENRQAGKVVVLSLGYGGSVGALAAMSKGYGVVIENMKAAVDAWRSANRWAVEWWAELDRAARAALVSPLAAWFPAGRVAFRREQWGTNDEGLPQYTLTLLLPSGRLLYYPYARLDEEGISYLKAAWSPKKDATEWPRARLWGGLLAENCTQAACADLLREALVTAIGAGLPVIAHVHDELVCEASVKDAPAIGILLRDIMLRLPQWAAGLPLAAETDISPRYRK